jgi:hypothetical protein
VGKTVTLKRLELGTSICADIDDILTMMQTVAKEKAIDINVATVEQKRQVLKSMGYEPYFEILKKEVEFQWL